MRKLIASLVIGLGLVAAFMVFVSPSMGQQPDPLPNRTRNVSLQGTVADMPSGTLTGTWMMTITDHGGNLWTITVTEETKLLPPGVTPEKEDSVHVLGSQGDGERTLLAKHVVTEKRSRRGARPFEFHGAIEDLPEPTDGIYSGTWVVAGVTFTVDAKTMIHPPTRTPTEGMQANVIAFEQPNGSLWAKNIALHGPDDEDQDEVEIEGVIKKLPSSDDFVGLWIVDGFTVTVTDTTDIEGSPAISLTAKVEGIRQGPNSLLATKIEIEEPEEEKLEFEGVVDSFTDTRPSLWTIYTEDLSPTGVISVWVYSTTHIIDEEGILEVGSKVEVKALTQEDGSLAALRIKVEDEDFGGSKWVRYEGIVSSVDHENEVVIETTDSGLITFELSSETKVVPPWADLAPGAEVEVKALERSDGSLLAFLIRVKRQEPIFVEFEGTVVTTDAIPGEWVIETVSPTERVTVVINSTRIVIPPRATLELSSSVKVRALDKGDSLVAVWVKVEMPDEDELEFEGTIVDNNEGEPGNWVIETLNLTERITIAVTGSTLLEPSALSLTVGSLVEVKAVAMEGGTPRALWIKLEEDDDDEEEPIEAPFLQTAASSAPLASESTDDKEAAVEGNSVGVVDASVRAASNWMLQYRGLRLGGPIE